MKILVTGASGFIGGRFARFALEQGFDVRVSGRRADGVEHLVRRGAEFIPGDLTDGLLVRDITVSGSLWGSRLFRANGPLMNIHSLAGAIGMGLPMAIGTAIANPQRKVVGLVGDGGLSLNLGELATLAQEKANVTLLIMNDGGYGVMRGIQDKYFGGRQYFNELHTPDFTLLAQAIGLQAWSVDRSEDFTAVMTEALAMPGPSVVEVKMGQIGALKFAGPPQKTLY